MNTTRRSTIDVGEKIRKHLLSKFGLCHGNIGDRDDHFIFGIHDVEIDEDGFVEPVSELVRYECLWCGATKTKKGKKWERIT